MKEYSRILRAITPARHADWISAILAEAETLSAAARFRWCLSALRFALGLRAKAWEVPLRAVALSLVMVAIDWWWGALLPALALAGLSVVVLEGNRHDGRVAAMFVAGATLPLAHAVANWTPALWPSYQYAPLDERDWLILAAVGAAGFCIVRIVEAGLEFCRNR